MSRFAAFIITLSLAACGMKGSLERPPGPAPEPLLGGKSANSAAVRDVSTPNTSPTARTSAQ